MLLARSDRLTTGIGLAQARDSQASDIPVDGVHQSHALVRAGHSLFGGAGVTGI